MNRLKSACIAAITIRCPMALYVYRLMQPFYIKYVIPKLFPQFTKNFTHLKRTFVSVVVDTYILKFLNTAIYMGGTNLIETNFDWESTKKLFRETYWTQMKVTFVYYTPYKIILYGWVPLYLRNIFAHIMSITWGIIFSFMQHM